MNGNEIKNILTEYLKRSRSDYAIMIDGNWGSGKTYFLVHTLPQIMTDAVIKRERKHYAYVSLYGINSIEEISKEIILQYFGRNNRKKIETVNNIMETTFNILTASLSVFNIDLSKASKKFTSINIENWVICFDDLERCCLPINEIFGFINNLVEHNNCGVIILANENEIGKMTLNTNLEQKYRVVLSGKGIKFSNDASNNDASNNEYIDIEKLKAQTKELFNEDFIYKTIREKVIGLTIKYEPNMEEVYDSIVNEFKIEKDFVDFLKTNKSDILTWFADEDCYNLRTLRISVEIIYKIYNKMNFDAENYQDKIMYEFLKYIVQFMIYYKNGGDIKKIELNSDIGYISLGQNIFQKTRGFKVLEQYCTTLNFSEDDFMRTITLLTMEYKEAEKNKELNPNSSLPKLTYWWELEDEQVIKLIESLKNEINDNKYPIYTYPTIIGRLISIEHAGFDVGNIDDIIKNMIVNIQNSSDKCEIDKYSYTLDYNTESQKRYESYIDELTAQLSDRQQSNYVCQINALFKLSNWTDEILKFYDKYNDAFFARQGFIDIVDIKQLVNNIKDATVAEIYTVRRIIRKVYAGGTNLSFKN
ncbi:MAG: P-loop NTPase fold protein, partial [Candidatus Ornithomonoglobus sp.]